MALCYQFLASQPHHHQKTPDDVMLRHLQETKNVIMCCYSALENKFFFAIRAFWHVVEQRWQSWFELRYGCPACLSFSVSQSNFFSSQGHMSGLPHVTPSFFKDLLSTLEISLRPRSLFFRIDLKKNWWDLISQFLLLLSAPSIANWLWFKIGIKPGAYSEKEGELY